MKNFCIWKNISGISADHYLSVEDAVTVEKFCCKIIGSIFFPLIMNQKTSVRL